MSPGEVAALRTRLANAGREFEETGRVLVWAAASASLDDVGDIAGAVPWHFLHGPPGLRGPLQELSEIAEAIEDELEPEHGRAAQRADDTVIERAEEERAAAGGQ